MLLLSKNEVVLSSRFTVKNHASCLNYPVHAMFAFSRFFYKEREEDNYVVYFPNFNLTARDPGNYGELAMITLPLSVQVRW